MIKLRNISNNFNILELDDVTIWFSYEEPISFTVHSTGQSMTRVNVWGPTTGKHINQCELDHSNRVSGDIFLTELAEIT